MCKHKLNASYLFHKAFLVFSRSAVSNLAQRLMHKIVCKLYTHIVKRSESSLVGKIETLTVKDILYRKTKQYEYRCPNNICHYCRFIDISPDKTAYKKIRHDPYRNTY